jgi:AcrR family transcriptional regulator
VTGTARTEQATPTGRSGRAAALPPDERRAAIVAAAIPLLRRSGHDVTTRQIADAAGIAEGTVFRAFPTKQAIIDAVLARVYDSGETIDRVRAIDRTAPLEDRVRQCAEILADRLSTVIDLMIALRMRGPGHQDNPDGKGGPGRAGQRHAGHGRHAQHPHQKQQGDRVAAIADLLAPDADRLACPPHRAAHLLRLLTFAGTHRMINDDDPLDPDEVADVLLHGILRAPDQAGLPPPATRS